MTFQHQHLRFSGSFPVQCMGVHPYGNGSYYLSHNEEALCRDRRHDGWRGRLCRADGSSWLIPAAMPSCKFGHVTVQILDAYVVKVS